MQTCMHTRLYLSFYMIESKVFWRKMHDRVFVVGHLRGVERVNPCPPLQGTPQCESCTHPEHRKIPGELLCEGFGEFLRGQCSGHIVAKLSLVDRMIQRK